jgi:hypothetical protein
MGLSALQNKEYVKKQKFDDDPNSVKATVLVEPCTSSLLATEIAMRMSRMGESRRRTSACLWIWQVLIGPHMMHHQRIIWMGPQQYASFLV